MATSIIFRPNKAAARAKINAAAEATDVIIENWNDAQNSLRTCWTNGAGALSDPSLVSGDLHRAKAAIERAIAALNACKWPTNDEYDMC